MDISFIFSAVNSMRQIDTTNCILVQDIKAVTHENAHIHDSISTQIPTEGKYRAVLICIYSAWCKYYLPLSRRASRDNCFWEERVERERSIDLMPLVRTISSHLNVACCKDFALRAAPIRRGIIEQLSYALRAWHEDKLSDSVQQHVPTTHHASCHKKTLSIDTGLTLYSSKD